MQQMGLNEIRSKFLKFFESKDHYLKGKCFFSATTTIKVYYL